MFSSRLRRAGRGRFGPRLRLQFLEERVTPTGFNTLLTSSELTLLGDTANGTSSVETFLPAMSADGRYVAFTSDAPNVLVGQVDTNGTNDVFLYDRVANSSVLVSGANGSPNETANTKYGYTSSGGISGGSSFASISADGRYVTFISTATNIVPGYAGGADSQNVYVYDRLTAQCKLASHRFDSATAGASSYSEYNCISLNGEFITFRSDAVDLVAGFPNPGGGKTTIYAHAYAYDIATEQVTLLDHKFGSVNIPANNRGNVYGAMSGSRYIVLQSYASDIWEQPTTTKQNLYLHDRQTGNNLLISKGTNTVAPFGGDGNSGGYPISADGKWMMVVSSATNLIPGATSSQLQIMLYDVEDGTLRLVSHAAGNPLVGGNGASQGGRMSSDGRYIAYVSKATNLINGFVDGNTADYADIFVYDRETDQTTLVNRSLASPTTSSNGSAEFSTPTCQISADGNYVLFANKSTDLVNGFVDGNGSYYEDFYRFNRLSGVVTLVSGKDNSNSIGGNGRSYFAAQSSDGKYVAIASDANDLSASISDVNGFQDLYFREMATGATIMASRRFGIPSLSAGGESFAVGTNQTPDGRFVVITSEASNLVPGQEDGPESRDVFLIDRLMNTTVLVSHAVGAPTKAANQGSVLPVISDDGRFVAYCSYATDLVEGFVDANGPHINSYYENTDVFLYDRLTGINELVSRKVGTTNVGGNYTTGTFFSQSGYELGISSDGRFVTFISKATDLIAGFVDNNGSTFNSGMDVFLFDRLSGTNALLNHVPGQPTVTGKGSSVGAYISSDGRYVAYSSNSTDTIPGMTGGANNALILYDRVTDSNVLITHTAASTTASSKGGGYYPNFSRDGKYIVFVSVATDLIAGGTDTNGASDIFLYDRSSGVNTLVSHRFDSPTMPGNWGNSLYPGRSISDDGRFIAYFSAAQDLVSGFVDGNGADSFDYDDVFVFDRITGTNTLVSRKQGSPSTSGNARTGGFSISGDGRFIAIASSATDLATNITFLRNNSTNCYVYDRQLGTIKLINHDAKSPTIGPNDGGGGLTVNVDGTVVVYADGSTNLVAGDLNKFSDLFAYVTAAPRVTSVQINDGSPQRSTIRSITVTIDDYVFVDSGSVSVVNKQGSGVSNQVSVGYVNNTTVLTVTFSGGNTEFGSLADGDYTLTLNASQFSGVALLDGNGDGVGGDNYSFAFHRLFGDSDGDAKVAATDYNAFRLAWATNTTTFDFNNDGIVNAADFNQFRLRYGVMM